MLAHIIIKIVCFEWVFEKMRMSWVIEKNIKTSNKNFPKLHPKKRCYWWREIYVIMRNANLIFSSSANVEDGKVLGMQISNSIEKIFQLKVDAWNSILRKFPCLINTRTVKTSPSCQNIHHVIFFHPQFVSLFNENQLLRWYLLTLIEPEWKHSDDSCINHK